MRTRIVIDINEDVVTMRLGDYEVMAKLDLPTDIKDLLEQLYDEHVISELLRDLYNEII